MNRGTLMVLKRFLIMALGALGLGAFVAGSALAQDGPGSGNIPAPDLFDDLIECSSRLPLAMAIPKPTKLVGTDDDATSLLDDAIGMGADQLEADFIGMSLGYVIPPGGNNCGSGDAFNSQADADMRTDSVFAEDVAEGYSAVLDKYVDVYGAPGDADSTGTAGAVKSARKALADADDDASDATLEGLREDIADAEERDGKARAALNTISGGPIYQAGLAEWMAKAAVTDAADVYNKAVVKAVGADGTSGARGALNGMNYADYVPLGDDSLIDGVVTISGTMGTVNLATLGEYTNADGTGMTATVGDDGVTESQGSNFDATGKLVVPMELDASTTEVEDDVTTTKAPATVMAIQTTVDNINTALAALKKLQAENENELLQPRIDQAVKRAQAEADHYNGQLSDTLGDDTDIRTTQQKDENDATNYVKDPITIASRNAAYQKAEGARVVAELAVRATAKAREDATAGVVTAFQSPSSFYDQLVARRQALQFAADKKVADASEDGGTASKSLTDAATRTAKAVADAEEARTDYLAYVGAEGDSPTAALIDELLKGEGDDGGALVEAISGTYNTAKEALDAVEGLGGEDGAVAVNTGDIEALDGRVATNETGIAANTTMIGENRTMIGTNATNIAANTGMIETNAGDIVTNAGNIAMNSGRIDTNEMGISMNSGRIDAAETMIGQNERNISGNTAMIGELSESLEVVRAGVAASMALAGMPAINGRGISIGVGSFDGESAFAIGFQIQNEATSFKVGLTSGGGATGASAGVGFQF